jgi:nucleotide-binding universal stress UspA family protein
MSTVEHNSESAVATQDTAAEIESSDRPCLVFATNGSAEANAALRFASALAGREELLLRVLTVLEPLPALPAQPAGAQWQITIETEQAESILERVRNELSLLGKPPSALTCMLVGNPGATIASAAREWNAKCVIVGAGRHRAIERFLAGDTVVRVMRHAIAPVIAVPASSGALPRNGVVAVDFGETSLAAARSAAEVIGEGVLHILHIRPEIDLPATDPSAWSDVYESGAQSLMSKLADELKSLHPSVKTTTMMLRGHVSTVLLDYADHVGADLIAVGQHGRGVVDRILFGSVAQAVVHSAHCAVLVSPPAGK